MPYVLISRTNKPQTFADKFATFSANLRQTNCGQTTYKRSNPYVVVFYSTESALLLINQQLVGSNEALICRDCFYRLRRIYCQIYPSYRRSGRIHYDAPTLLYLYYCAKAHNRVGRYDLLLAYMQQVDQELANRGVQFCDLYGSFSQINTHFLQAAPIVA